MNYPLLSVITPSYNCGEYLSRLLDSILVQSYPSIEMFLIDDGSTDDTKGVVLTYIEKFSKRGYTLNYIYQENAGQSVALNRGLKMIHGDFLVWPDADDWYKTEDAIEKLISTLIKSPQTVGMVRCEAELIDEETLNVKKHLKPVDSIAEPNFDDCFYERHGFWVVPGDYIVRVSAIHRTIVDSGIYTEKSAGQNIQLFYPIMYSYGCVTINESLYCVLDRSSSHSRLKRSLSKQAERLRVYARTRINTLNRIVQMPQEIKMKYKQATYMMYRDDIIHMYLDDGNIAEAVEVIEILKENNIRIPLKYRIRIRFNSVYRLIKDILKM